MAAIQALVNQTTGSSCGQPEFHLLLPCAAPNTARVVIPSCNSSLGNGVSNTCIFYDVTQGDMDVNCTGTHNCYSGLGHVWRALDIELAYQPAYGTNIGWDFATGIGTVNANNLVNNWPKPRSAVLSITSTHTGNFTQGQKNATYTVTVSNAASAGRRAEQ